MVNWKGKFIPSSLSSMLWEMVFLGRGLWAPGAIQEQWAALWPVCHQGLAVIWFHLDYSLQMRHQSLGPTSAPGERLPQHLNARRQGPRCATTVLWQGYSDVVPSYTCTLLISVSIISFIQCLYLHTHKRNCQTVLCKYTRCHLSFGMTVLIAPCCQVCDTKILLSPTCRWAPPTTHMHTLHMASLLQKCLSF